jgi:hypothetical protein
MPIIEFNDKLTRIVRGRTIQLVAQEEGLVTIVFHDYSTMRVKVAGGPTMNMLGECRIESVGDDHQVCHAYERYRDSAAFMTHLESFGANFAVRLMEAVTPARLVVYGTPSPQVKDALAGLSPVYMAPLGGFRR